MKFSIGHTDWPLSNKSFAKFDLVLPSLNSLKCSLYLLQNDLPVCPYVYLVII
jgi:hypothetical protein